MKNTKILLSCLILSLCTALFISCQSNTESDTATDDTTAATTASATEQETPSASETTEPEPETTTVPIIETQTTRALETTQAEPETTTASIIEAETTFVETTTSAKPETTPETEWVDLHVDDYTISYKDGAYYLNFDGGNQATQSDIAACQVPDLYFPSLAYMKDAILNGKLSDKKKASMRVALSKNENGIKLCDMNNLSSPIVPDCYPFPNAVFLDGAGYDFALGTEYTNGHGLFSILSEEKYNDHLGTYHDYIENAAILSVTDTEYDGIACKLYMIQAYRVVQKIYRFEMTFDEKHLYIEILYIHKHELYPDLESDSIPYSVKILGEENGRFFEVYLAIFTSTPAAEFLTSFGVVPYLK